MGAPSAARRTFPVAYSVMVGGAILIFLVVRRYGATLTAPAGTGRGVTEAVAAASPDALFHLLLALAAVLATGKALGALFQAVGQAPVIGEVVGGILLGPSLLGRISPAAAQFILPSSIAPLLNSVAQLGVILYMFLVGLELNADLVRKRAHTTVAISHASIIAPFLLGSVLALYLYPRMATSDVPFTSFALF